MADSETIKSAIRAIYEARCRGDLEGGLAYFTDDVVYEFNGKGTGLPEMSEPARGKAAFRSALKSLIDNFQLNDWQEVSLIVEGDRAALRWRANVKFAGTGRTEPFDVVDLFIWRGGKFIDLHQNTDTAQLKAFVAM